MKIAVTYENKSIFAHFGHTRTFKIYEVENGAVKASTLVQVEGSGHGALAGFLRGQGVTELICGGIGAGAQNALAEAGIRLYAGVEGDADAAVLALLAGTLKAQATANCSHHDHEHTHGETGGCGGSCHG